MKKNILQQIQKSKQKGEKLLAILFDPDKLAVKAIPSKFEKINANKIDFIFVGGSTVNVDITEKCVKIIKKYTSIPIILFPGDYTQLTDEADGLLYLSLLSGRNPEYLIGQQVKSVGFLKTSSLEIISTGYILIDGGTQTAVQKVSNTLPISPIHLEKIVDTAIAGQYLGNQLIYLEAGSGAKIPVAASIIKTASNNVSIPIIVGGGIRTKEQLEIAYKNGADIVVIGTAFEENDEILNKII